MKTISNAYLLADQVKDTIAVHGHAATAKLYAKKIPFTVYHYYAFGFLPRTVLKVESNSIKVIRCII